MNIPYLLKALNTNKLSDLTAAIDGPTLDMNLAIWDALDNKEIEINEKKDRVKSLVEDVTTWHDMELADKFMRVIEHYANNQTNITKGRLLSYIKDPLTSQGYPAHECFMTLQFLIDSGQIVEEVVSVPKIKGRPYHRFVFLCLPGKPNEEWNAKAVNKWIANWNKNKVK